jgi:hypothetical protein
MNEGQSRDKPAKPPVNPDRTARQAAALRANLGKRKDQARRRESEKEKPQPEGGNDPVSCSGRSSHHAAEAGDQQATESKERVARD